MTEEPTPTEETPAAPDEAAPPAPTADDGPAEEAEAPELDSEGEPIPESHTAFHGAPEGYELPARLPEALEAERLAAEPPPVEPEGEENPEASA